MNFLRQKFVKQIFFKFCSNEFRLLTKLRQKATKQVYRFGGGQGAVFDYLESLKKEAKVQKNTNTDYDYDKVINMFEAIDDPETKDREYLSIIIFSLNYLFYSKKLDNVLRKHVMSEKNLTYFHLAKYLEVWARFSAMKWTVNPIDQNFAKLIEDLVIMKNDILNLEDWSILCRILYYTRNNINFSTTFINVLEKGIFLNLENSNVTKQYEFNESLLFILRHYAYMSSDIFFEKFLKKIIIFYKNEDLTIEETIIFFWNACRRINIQNLSTSKQKTLEHSLSLMYDPFEKIINEKSLIFSIFTKLLIILSEHKEIFTKNGEFLGKTLIENNTNLTCYFENVITLTHLSIQYRKKFSDLNSFMMPIVINNISNIENCDQLRIMLKFIIMNMINFKTSVPMRLIELKIISMYFNRKIPLKTFIEVLSIDLKFINASKYQFSDTFLCFFKEFLELNKEHLQIYNKINS